MNSNQKTNLNQEEMCFFNTNVVAFAGRMSSGKSELAKVCQAAGYEKIYFALPLKQLSAKMLSITIDELNHLKASGEQVDLKMDNSMIDALCEATGLENGQIKEICGNNTILHTVRDILQFVGTDIIRKLCPNWHVEHVISMMQKDKKYVIDDVRFKNELNALMRIGAVTWFVIRPDMFKVSHHESEENLRWQDFGNKVIVNDCTLEELHMRWNVFFSDYSNNIEFRDTIFSKLNCIGRKNIGCDLMFMPRSMFEYQKMDFSKTDIFKTEDSKLIVNGIEITNPFNIEDAKFLLNKFK